MQNNNASQQKQPQQVYERQLLIKFGHILKKEIQRWYEINFKEESIDYYTSQSAKKVKGRILLRQIGTINSSCDYQNQDKCSKDRRLQHCISIVLNNRKTIYLFQQDKQRLDQLISILTLFKQDQKMQGMNRFAKVEALRFFDINSYNEMNNQQRILEQKNELEQIDHPHPSEQSYYLQLMPESISQRNISQNKSSIQNDDLHNINESQKKKFWKNDSKEESKVQVSAKRNSQNQQLGIYEEEDNAKRQRVGKENQQKDQSLKGIAKELFPNNELEDKCMRFNDEITEVLSREETENTNRVQIFSKLYSLNDNFQIQKIKKQIQHSSNNLLRATQESTQEINITKNNNSHNNYYNSHNYNLMNTSLQEQYRYSTIPSPQSQLIKNPFSNPAHQSINNISFKQLPTLPQTTTALGASFHGNSFRFNTLIDSNREQEQQINYSYQEEQVHSQQLNNEYENNIINISQQSPYIEEDYPMYLSSTIRERIQKQCSNADQEKYQINNRDAQSDYQRRQSISEIESESNLASIKQLNCDIKSRHFLKDTLALELQNQFKRQSYFFQEFNTLITMNTQYLGGSTLINTKALNQGLTMNKRDSLYTYMNNRSQTLDQQSERFLHPGTPQKKDLFVQGGSITSRSNEENKNSVKQYSNDYESQKQFYPAQEDNDGFSDDYIVYSDKDVDKVANLIDNYTNNGKMTHCFKKTMSSLIGDSPKRFPRQSNFNASFMRREKKDTDSINSKKLQISSQPSQKEEDDKLLHSLKIHSEKFLMPRLNQIPLKDYCLNKLPSDNNMLIDFDTDNTEVKEDNNQPFGEDLINASNNMLAIQKISYTTKTKSDQDSQPALSNRENYSMDQIQNSPLLPNKIQIDNQQANYNKSNLSNINLQQQNVNQSTAQYQNSYIQINTPIKNENDFFSPTKYPKQFLSDCQQSILNLTSLDVSKRDQSAQSQKSLNFSKYSLEKAMIYVWDFQFTKAQCIFEDFNNKEDVSMISGYIFMLLIQFLCSLKTDYAEKVCKLCEKAIDIIMAQRVKNNQYLLLVQEIYLAEMYLIKGVLQFSLDKKIQGLFSVKNAYKYYQKCISCPPMIRQNLRQHHKNKIDLLEGISHLSKSTLQESFKKVLSFFGQTFDLEKGLKILFQVASGDQNYQTSSNKLDIQQNNPLKDQKYQEYLTKTQESENSIFISHIATVFITLYYVWREKNPTPVIRLINTKTKQYPSSPIYCWLSYLIQFERNEHQKAINDINRAITKSNQFKQQCLSFKFEKSLFLTSNLLWKDALQILGLVGVQLLAFEEFKYDAFKQILVKAKINSNHFINFYRMNVSDFKPEKHFFIGVSNLLLTQVACYISQKNIEFAKEWLLLSQYFKKYTYLSGFMNNDMHTLSQIYLKRNNFTFVKYEIMYFTKTITKIPTVLIQQILEELDFEKKNYFRAAKLNNEEQKLYAVEQSSFVFLRILIGCLQFDNQIIEESEQELESIIKYQNDKNYADNSYLHHHSYYWICKFYFLQEQYDKVLKNVKKMQKYPSKIFCLSAQADNLVKLIQNMNTLTKNKNNQI